MDSQRQGRAHQRRLRQGHEKLGPLLKRGILRAAIVPRFTFPAPGPETPRMPGEWFTNQYQILRSAKLAAAKP